MRLVTKMRASFKKLTHREFRKCHIYSPVVPPQGRAAGIGGTGPMKSDALREECRWRYANSERIATLAPSFFRKPRQSASERFHVDDTAKASEAVDLCR
jgi:hypothetical protein